jgi:hypothetical protein
MKLHPIIILALLFWLSTPVLSSEPSDWSVGIAYPDEESRIFLKAVLKSMNLAYKEIETVHGNEIRWKSESKAQEEEVQNRVSQYTFIKEVCKNIELPSPSAPTRAELSCSE